MLTAGLGAIALSAVLPGTAHASGALRLPRPTGRYPVGATTVRLVDRARRDPWHPEFERELMITIHYPALPSSAPGLPYMLPLAARHFSEVTMNQYLGLNLPNVDWTGVQTNAIVNGRRRPGRWPTLLHSAGLGEPRTWGTWRAEELASHGFRVVTVDHTFESPEVQFPGGILRTLTLPDDPNVFIRKAVDVRVDDLRFVLDQVSPRGRVGAFGSSMGGSAAAMAMHADHRIGAGVNLDGNLTYPDGALTPVARDGLDRPFLLVGSDGPTDTGPGWDAFLDTTTGWSRRLRLRGAKHASFTDAEALVPQLGLSPAAQAERLGTLNPAEAIRTTGAYLVSFFDRFLRDEDDHLLDAPSPDFPAMEFPS